MKVNTVRQLIDHFGGNAKFAEAIGDRTSPQAVNNWYRDDELPANTYRIVNNACDIAGVRILDSMFAMRPRRKKRR